jgi:hypothetical protein
LGAAESRGSRDARPAIVRNRTGPLGPAWLVIGKIVSV